VESAVKILIYERNKEEKQCPEKPSFYGTFQNDEMIMIFSLGVFPGAIVRTIL